MSIGSILVGTAALLVVAAYVARPFRTGGGTPTDRAIEAWVAETRGSSGADAGPARGADEAPVPSKPEKVDGERVVNFCPQCGQRAEPGDRFCSGCGTPLRRTS